MSTCQYEMKVPIRPAPPPPVNKKFPQKSVDAWNELIKDTLNKSAMVPKKKPPPRPPPPRFFNQSKKAAPSKQSQLVADLFHRKNQFSSRPSSYVPRGRPVGVSDDTTIFMLIDFSSPPSSPTFTTRSSSDALSVNSFGSDGLTQCSGSSGNASNAESGFEDDFELFGGTSKKPDSQQRDPWSPFPKPPEAKNPFNKKTNSWVKFPSPSSSKKIPQVGNTMPTIIRSKPEGYKAVQKVSDCARSSANSLADVFRTGHSGSTQPALGNSVFEDDNDSWLSESPPMPTCPPPAPPPEIFDDLQNVNHSEAKPHGVALYDYKGEQNEDLSFKKGDVINLVRKIDENWFVGEIGGRQGSVPANFISIRVSLSENEIGDHYVTALYAFHPETWEDLEFEEGYIIKVTHIIDQDWLYGECNGKSGQFPASFVDHVPSHLPLRKIG